jgi:septum formation protein
MFGDKDFHLLLGSGSPRRKELLENACIPFEQKYFEVEEVYPINLEAEKVAEYLARLKAEGGKHFLKDASDILLTADTVVIFENEILGKPEDEEDACRMLHKLSGQWHSVITGVVLKSLDKELSFSARSEVLFDKLTKEEIDYYIKNYKPFDKAGAYGIQEWIGWSKISKINGLYSNIMGLPVQLVYRELQNF